MNTWTPTHGPSLTILGQVDWWATMYSCPCPQSHLARALGLTMEALQPRLQRLVADGTLVYAAQHIGGYPDVKRPQPSRIRRSGRYYDFTRRRP
ncbi:MAG TPA: hypothetical protein VKT52_09275 [Ktedonobacterales bacterium]|nr:hypothetical protein [Ktedonobacterales bacterium]